MGLAFSFSVTQEAEEPFLASQTQASVIFIMSTVQLGDYCFTKFL